MAITTRSILLLTLLALASPACTIDDEVVEGKHCNTGTGDPDKVCMTGYECKCGGGECLCVKIEALRLPPPEPRLVPHSPARPDPSRCLLQRLGLTPP